METLEGILLIAYWIAGYWAVGQTLWANKVVFGSAMKIFSTRSAWGFLLGWILIPIALVKTFKKP